MRASNSVLYHSGKVAKIRTSTGAVAENSSYLPPRYRRINSGA